MRKTLLRAKRLTKGMADCYAVTLKDIPIIVHTKLLVIVMVLGVMSSEGDVMPSHFFSLDLRVNAVDYKRGLEMGVRPHKAKIWGIVRN